MPRQARVEFVSLKSSLVNLPVSLFGPLLERNIASPSFYSSVLYIDLLLASTTPRGTAHCNLTISVRREETSGVCRVDWDGVCVILGPL